MAAAKKPVRQKTGRKTTARAKTRPKPRTKPLAISAHVRREAPSGRSLLDTQMDLLRVMMTWSPMGVMLTQQAAFWEGAASAKPKDGARKRSLRGRSK